MTRPRIPEDTKPDYDAEPEPQYDVTFPDGFTATVNKVEIAQVVVDNGGSVDAARKGWD